MRRDAVSGESGAVTARMGYVGGRRRVQHPRVPLARHPETDSLLRIAPRRASRIEPSRTERSARVGRVAHLPSACCQNQLPFADSSCLCFRSPCQPPRRRPRCARAVAYARGSPESTPIRSFHAIAAPGRLERLELRFTFAEQRERNVKL